MDELRDLVALGREMYQRGDYARAASHLEEAVARGQGYPDVHYMLGCIYHELGEFESAEVEFTHALEMNPGYVEAALNLAIVCNDLGKYEKARTVYVAALRHAGGMSKAAASSPSSSSLDSYTKGKIANMHAAVADAYIAVHKPDEAAAEYRRALLLCPGFADLRLKLAHALRDAGQDELALAEYRLAADAAAAYLPARVALGTQLYAMGKLDEAVLQWEEVVRADPAHRTATLFLKLARGQLAGGAGTRGGR